MEKRWICLLLVLVLTLSMVHPLAVRAETSEKGGSEELTATDEATESEEMTVSNEFVELLKQMEGFHHKAYWDYSQWTIGYGTRCPDDKVYYYTDENPLTEEEAEAMLYEELVKYEDVVRAFAKKYSLTFSQNQYDALVSFTYNCGGSWTGDVNGYFNTAVRSGDVGSALIYGMCLFSTAGDEYILIRRRLCEANMYINGEYKNYTNPNNIPSNYKYVFLDGNGGTLQYVIQGYDSLQTPGIIASFKTIPTGVDEEGNVFVYTLEGWYTDPADDSTRVEALDGSLENGTILYARWADPQGQTVELPVSEAIEPVEVTVTGNTDVYNGAGMQYKKVSTVSAGTTITITGVLTVKKYLWGQFDGGWIKLIYTDYEEVLEEQKEWPRWGTVNGTGVNVRSGPGTSYDKVGQKNTGDRVEIYEKVYAEKYNWGRMADDTWICLDYVTFDEIKENEGTEEPEEVTLVSLTLLSGPDKTEYVQMQDLLDPTGSALLAMYSDGSAVAKSITRSMVTGFSNEKLGEVTVSAWHEGVSVTFTVTIIKATVTFVNEDGTVLSSAQYAYGETVTEPEVPTKPGDEAGEYVFAGWSPAVTTCCGNATYTAVFKLITEENPEVPDYIPGDTDGNGLVNEDDAIYLLRYVFFPEDYPVTIPVDYTGDGNVNEDDAIYLLRYVFFPEDYPLIDSGV